MNAVLIAPKLRVDSDDGFEDCPCDACDTGCEHNVDLVANCKPPRFGMYRARDSLAGQCFLVRPRFSYQSRHVCVGFVG